MLSKPAIRCHELSQTTDSFGLITASSFCWAFQNVVHLGFMVAGGAVDQLTKDTETATTELLFPGTSSWIQGTPLPKAQGGVRAASCLDGILEIC